MPRGREHIQKVIVPQPIHVHVAVSSVPVPLRIGVLKEVDWRNRLILVRKMVAIIYFMDKQTVVMNYSIPLGNYILQRIGKDVLQDHVRSVKVYATGAQTGMGGIGGGDIGDRTQIEEGADWVDVESSGEAQPPGLPRVELPSEPFIIHSHAIPDIRVVPIASGLSHPWSLAFLPGGDMLVTERHGALRLVRDGKLLPDPIAGVPTDIKARGFSGLMEVAIHPEFEQNRLIYLTYTRALPDGQGGVALVRGRFVNDKLHDVEDVFFVEPWNVEDALADPLADLGTFTASARLAFAPDGTLFMTVGGAFGVERIDGDTSFWGNALLAQDPNSHVGKLLRMNDDGSVPADNPFARKSGYNSQLIVPVWA